MKRCPQCGRDYTDDTLSFCLDDGTSLLDGPASMDEPATAILPDAPSTSESPTRIYDHEPADSGESDARRDKTEADSAIPGFRTAIIVGACLIAGIVLAGVYLMYFRASGDRIESIAVMPFANETGNADLEYLADGMTESLITSLSTIPDLSVKARSSVFRWKGKDVTSAKIGSELGVQALLVGRLAARPEGILLRLELVDVGDETVLWSDSFERRADDLIALQKEVAEDVSKRLRLSLSSGDRVRLTKSYTENAEAHRAYLKGRFHLEKRNTRDIDKARGYFEEAVELDRGYALAHVGLADAYGLIPVYDPIADPKKFLPLAREAALEAIQLDPKLAEAHASLGHVLFHYYWDFPAAEKSIRRALELNPGYATAHLWYSEFLGLAGRHAEELVEVRKAVEMEPFSLVFNRMLGKSLANNGMDEEAIGQLKRTIDLFPNDPTTRLDLAELLAHRGRFSEALSFSLESRRLRKLDKEWLEKLEAAAKEDGWTGYQMAYAEYCEEQRKSKRHFSSYSTAQAYSFIGDKDKAIEALNRAFEERDIQLPFLRQAAAFSSIKDDPRFVDLVRKIGLPE